MNERKILKEKLVTTRVDHHCHGCGRKFKKGTIMNSALCKFNTKLLVRKYFCESCNYIMTTRNIQINGFWYGDMLKDALAYERSKEN